MINENRNVGEIYQEWNLENPQYLKNSSERKRKKKYLLKIKIQRSNYGIKIFVFNGFHKKQTPRQDLNAGSLFGEWS